MLNLKLYLRYQWLINQYARALPYISLLIWVVPLLMFSSGHSSLMAHDEGLYAIRARLMFDSGDWIHPWSNAHHKTPGFYWLIAASYQLFGIHEYSVRLPNLILSISSTLVLYEIGKILLNKKIAWLAAAILNLEFLWLQYSRLGTPDVPMIFLVLLGILSLLKAELYPQRSFWCFICGLSFGLGLLVRSLMIILPIVALFPYLIWGNRRNHLIFSPYLYLGFLIGLMPTIIWAWLCFLHYGNTAFSALFSFVWRLSSQERSGNSILFYFWNIPVKSFPWFFFAIFGLFLSIQQRKKNLSIIAGFPILLFFELSLFSTRLSHYSLCLYPFIALLAAIGLDAVTQIFIDGNVNKKKEVIKIQNSHLIQKLPRYLSFGFGGIGIISILASLILVAGNSQIHKYATLILVVGVGWLTLPIVWIRRYSINNSNKNKFLTAAYWLAGWLIPVWLGLAVAGVGGFFSDYNPDFRSFIQRNAIAQILQSSPINFVNVGGKTGVMIIFYTKNIDKEVVSLDKLSANSYAWIPTQQASASPIPHRTIGIIQKYSLVQLKGSREYEREGSEGSEARK